MIYLSGGNPHKLPEGVGVMMTQRMGNRVPTNRIWAADTGCFTHPHTFRVPRYLTWLRQRTYQELCLFATAPDVVGEAATTLERSAPVLPLIRELGYKAALVGQDGLETLRIPWDSFDALFIGGTTNWKCSEAAHALIREAKMQGKWVHVGRVNSLVRMQAFHLSGADSADGTHIAFRPQKYGQAVIDWLATLERQPPLWRSS